MLAFFHGTRLPTSVTLELSVVFTLVVLLVVYEYLRQTAPRSSNPWRVLLTLLMVLTILIFGVLVARRLLGFVVG